MKISVIIPVYNAAATLRRCVESCVAPKGESIEILLVDDGSTDGALDLARALAAERPAVRCLRQAHAGASEARNLGLREARGEWIAFLDADDVLCDGALQALSDAVDGSTDACCGRIVRGTESVRPQSAPDAPPLSGHALLDYALCNPTDRLTIHGWMFRRSVCAEGGIAFDPALRLGEDSDWVLRCLSACRQARFIGAPVYRYTLSPESTIHRWKPGQTQAYLDMLGKLGRSPASSEASWPLYVLTTLLLILTHDTFHPANPASLAAQFREARRLRMLPVFSEAFRRADLKGMSLARRATLACLKARLYAPVWAAVKLRQAQNARHQNQN